MGSCRPETKFSAAVLETTSYPWAQVLHVLQCRGALGGEMCVVSGHGGIALVTRL